MSDKTAISWTDATFNPWWGCTKVSPACDHCYAERDAKRFASGRVLWGVGSERRMFGDAHWASPLKWAKTMPAKLGRRPRVFCASMADVFDKDAPAGERERLFKLIDDTPELDWLLLTKRIGNAVQMVVDAQLQIAHDRGEVWGPAGALPRNVWLGATVVNQEEADRDIPKLLATPARLHFLSIEPMLGPISLRRFLGQGFGPAPGWVIVGGESGPGARPMHPDWARSLRDRCAAAGVPFHFKQWGEWIARESVEDTRQDPTGSLHYERAHDMTYRRVGKKAAGRLLDGIEHNGFPT
jgi:protein gp37